jgi:hypothetical protein
MGVKAGLDAAVMIEVLNAGSGATHASRDKFPRSILPRTFDYGFATGLMVKDVRPRPSLPTGGRESSWRSATSTRVATPPGVSLPQIRAHTSR